MIAPASTGRLSTNRIAVTTTAHKNRGSLSKEKTFEEREVKIVDKKLIEPRIDLIPER